MKKVIIPLIITSMFLTAFTFFVDENVLQARKIVNEFVSKLKAELVQSMKSGGPTAAIEVCHTEAPAIAKESSDSTGWHVARTSLKPRNKMNKPEEWERKVLEQFEERKANGTEAKDLEFSEIIEKDGRKYFRYMKAIPTGSLCLKCHGSEISEDVKEKINELYPDDKATGYSAGDIRGAFTLQKEIK